MEVKLFEVRDVATSIPMIAVLIAAGNAAEAYLIRRTGYGSRQVILTRLSGDSMAKYDPHAWSDDRLAKAHRFILNNWDRLDSGEVIDIEFILGESSTKKVSEAYGQG